MAEQKKEIAQVAAPQPEASVHGDMLESIFSRVPLIDLVPACQVSKSWNCAVSSSLRCRNKLKPWLLLHSQRTGHPYSTIMTYAYDPRSRLWVRIQIEPSIKCTSALLSSHSTLLYMLSNKFSFSFDPLHLTWQHVDPPLVCRSGLPIVAFVRNRVVVAGGGWFFEDDPLAVETYDLEAGNEWEMCDSMPEFFKDSADSVWVSVAVDSNKMHVVEKSTGVAYCFDPATKAWQGPYHLRPDTSVCCSLIGFSNGRLILIGLTGVIENGHNQINGLKIWELNCESLEHIRQMGEMPEPLLESLKGHSCSMFSISFNFVGNFVYINNSSSPGEIVLCELGNGGTACSWGSFNNILVNDDSLMAERLVFTCANVGLSDLHRAMTSQDCKVPRIRLYRSHISGGRKGFSKFASSPVKRAVS